MATQSIVEHRIERVYKEAQRDLKRKLKEYTESMKVKSAQMKARYDAGEITDAEYQTWVQGVAFHGKLWQEKLDQITMDLKRANELSVRMINGERQNLFAMGATMQNYLLEHDKGINYGFGVYDSATVARLLTDNPKLLPPKKLDPAKDVAWSKTLINNCIVQGAIQGESMDKIASRIATTVASSDASAMLRTARTAMTSAQNAGRMVAMQNQVAMGLNVQKMWIATLDSRTRDSHRYLDGAVANVDEPFQSLLGKIMYPGDPEAENKSDVYNCRCTLGYRYPDTPAPSSRRDQETGEIIANMTYKEWSDFKTAGKLKEFNGAKMDLLEVQELIFAGGGEHVFKGIWKTDVTYADYIAKEASIPAKRQYFEEQLKRATQNGDTAAIDKFQHLLSELDLFEKNGLTMNSMLDLREVYIKELNKLLREVYPQQAAPSQFDIDSWSAARKSAAKRFTSRVEADKRFYRPWLDKSWDARPDQEKFATWLYTQNSNPMNRPLSGYDDSWSRSAFSGPQNVEWGHEDHYGNRRITGAMRKFARSDGSPDYRKAIMDLTRISDSYSLPDDAWMVRGSSVEGLAGWLEGQGMTFDEAMRLLERGSESKVQAALVGHSCVNEAFTSAGIATNAGFSGSVTYEIYAPKGTHCVYAEPQSYYGATASDHIYRAGEAYSGVGGEAECIIQRGTKYRITDIQGGYGTWTVTMEVVEQPDYFVDCDENTFDGGLTHHLK